MLVNVGDVVERDGFWFADLRPTETTCDEHPGYWSFFLDR